MNISSLLTAFTLARGEQGQPALAEPAGAEFAASLGAPDLTLPVAPLKGHAPKTAGAEAVLALIAQADVPVADAKVDLPVSWQAPVSDQDESADPSAKSAPKLEDSITVDAAIAYSLAAPPLMPRDLKPSVVPEDPPSLMPPQAVVTVPDSHPVKAQGAVTGSSADVVPPAMDQPLSAAGESLATSPDPSAVLAQNLPPLPDRGSLLAGEGRAKVGANVERIVQGQGGKGQRHADKGATQGDSFDSLDKARGLDVGAAVPQRQGEGAFGPQATDQPPVSKGSAVQGPSARIEDATPRLTADSGFGLQSNSQQTVGRGSAVQDKSAVIKGAAPQRADSMSRVQAGDSLHLDAVAPLPNAKTAPSGHDLALPSAVMSGASDPPSLVAAQASPAMAQESLGAGRVVARVAAKPAVPQRAPASAAVALPAAGAPFDRGVAQVAQPFSLISAPSEAPAKGGDGSADPAAAFLNAPEGDFGAALQASGPAMTAAPLAQTATHSAQPIKGALGLHQLPAVIEHLHQGAVRDGHSHAELLMNPAELGRIRFDLITQGDQVQVTLSVERPETLDLLRANSEALRQEFRAAGLTADTLNFGQWAQRAPSRDQAQSPLEQAAPATVPQGIAAPYIKPVSASGLDLRL